MGKKNKLRFIYIIFLILLFSFVFLEFWLHLSGLLSKMENDVLQSFTVRMSILRFIGQNLEPDKYLFWKLKDENSITNTNDLKDVSGNHKIHDNIVRILALGDSCTFGINIDKSNNWPSQLQNQLNASFGANSYQVINQGVPGYSSFQGLRLLKKNVDKIQPNFVILGFGINDSSPVAAASESFLASFFELSRFEQIFAWSHAFRILRLWYKSTLLEEPKSPNDYLEYFKSANYKPRVSLNEFENNLLESYKYCKTRNIKVIYLLWAMRCQFRKEIEPDYGFLTWANKYEPYQQVIRKVAASTNAPLIDSLLLFANNKQSDIFIDSSIHPTRLGYSIIAQAIFTEVQNLSPNLHTSVQ